MIQQIVWPAAKNQRWQLLSGGNAEDKITLHATSEILLHDMCPNKLIKDWERGYENIRGVPG